MARVLVIEDERLLREHMSAVLMAQGHDVIEAENGEVAIAKLKETAHIPELILLDMVMPVLNGWDFLDFQRSHPQFKTIPLVIVSAFEEMAKSAKPHAFLQKPVEDQDLIDIVARFA